MFFLRCVFWLAIVYASMSWTRDELASGGAGRPAAAPGAIAGLLAARVEAGAAAFCKHQPARCVADAARLTALIDGAEAEDQASARAAPSGALPETVPLPVPAPRRHARASMETQGR